MYQQRDIKERYAPQEIPPKKDMEIIVKERQNEKNEKKKDIKEVLIEAVRLKTKLKNQLDNLKSKVKIDEKIVIEQLLKAGIELSNN
jgi:16S rRNA G1207 methylase RsmC